MMLRMAATPSLTSLSLRNPNLRFCISLFSPKPFSLCFLPNLRPSITTAAVAATSAAASGTTTITSPPSNLFNADLQPYLSCSLPNKRLKIAVLLSGGVDSSVALRLLHAAGHSCTAFYLKIWFQEDFENFWSECPWEDDLNYAKAVCDQIRTWI